MRLFLLFMLMVAAPSAWAVEKLNYPAVVKDRMQVEYLGFGEQELAGDDRWRHRTQITYGVTDRLDLAVSGYAENRSGRHSEFAGPSVRARWELTTQNEDGWWLSSGVQTRYLYATDGGPDQSLTRLLFQRRQGDVLGTVNIGLARTLGNGRDAGITASFAGQLIYEVDPTISPGVEFFSGAGKLNNLTAQSQSQELGPIVSGTLPIAPGRDFTYVAGYYRGLSSSAPEQSAKLQLNFVQQF